MHTTDHLSTADVAALAETHVSTVSRWATSGELPIAFRLGGGSNGGAMFFRRQDVERFLKARKAEAAA